MDNYVEFRMEDGSLNVYCACCGNFLTETTKKLKDLKKTGRLSTIHVLCERCNAELKFKIKLGNKEVAKTKKSGNKKQH